MRSVVFSYWSYKACVQDRIRELRSRRAVMTQSYVAERLGVQASYLSRVLNDEKAQFSEDQLYRLLEVIGFDATERDFLLLLRTYETTSLKERRLEIENRIRALQGETHIADLHRLKNEMESVLEQIRRIALPP